MKLIYLNTKTAWPVNRQLTSRCGALRSSWITKPTVALTKKNVSLVFSLPWFLHLFFCFVFFSFLCSSFFCDYFLCTQHRSLICIPLVFSISHIFHCFSLMQILIHLVFILVFFFFFLSSALRERCQLNIQFEIAQLQTKGIFFPQHICLRGRQALTPGSNKRPTLREKIR